MKKFVLLGAIVFIVVVLATLYEEKFGNTSSTLPGKQGSNNQTASSSDNADAVAVVAKNLSVPWAIVFLPDGRFMFTERSGDVKIFDPSGKFITALSLNVYRANDTEGGLLGMALSPKFSSNHYVFLYYTYTGSGNKTFNRVVRMTFQNDKLTNSQTIVDAIPGALYHNGGRLKFGPDGYLHITTGDSESPSLAQNKNSLAGKILKVDENGKAAPGNPFGTIIYSYGHRNPQGITWDQSGNLYETEHGRSNPTGFDEINQIKPGLNYGWPTIQGDQTKSGMVTPLANSGANGTWAPSGAAYYNGSVWFGGLKGEALYQYDTSTHQITEHLKKQYGRLRDVVLGPDNMLYVTTSNRDGRGNPGVNDDQILRIDPTKL